MLKEKFDGAHEVTKKTKRGRKMLVTRKQHPRFKSHTDTDLVYLVTSPDYCEYDVKKGSLGTKGRECDPVSLHFVLFFGQKLFSFFSRPRRELMVAICCAATEATPPGERWGRNVASVSSTGVATWSARSVNGRFKYPRVTRHVDTCWTQILEAVLFVLKTRN